MRGPFVVPDVPVPAELGARGTEGASDTMALGALTVRLLVDSLGRVMRGSVQVLDSPTPDIAEAFTVAAEGWRFRPAELAPGCTVSDDVRLRFQLRWRPGGGVVIAPVPAAA